jgi:hypothetical protein
MRKVGIPFSAGFSTHGDVAGIANTITAQFRLDSATSTEVWAPVTGPFVEATPGYYVAPVTLETAGLYQFRFVSTDPRIGTHEGKVECSFASIDDIKNLIDTVQSDVSAIKTQVDILDEATINGLSAKVDIVDGKLLDLLAIVDDTSNPAIVSLRELLNDITAAENTEGSVLDTLSNTLFTSNEMLTAMIRGDANWTVGGVTDANPFFGKTTHDIYDLLVSVRATLLTELGTVEAGISANISVAKDAVINSVNAVKTVVDANSAQLTDSAHGLAALKSMLDGINTNIDNGSAGTDSIISILNGATDGLAAIKTAIMDKLTIMDGKLDSIAGSVSSTTEVKVIL